jgi:hypothetical protein
VAPGGGENRNTEADGFSKDTDVNAVSKAGRPVLPAAFTCTRSGTPVSLSIASRTSPTSERVSRGCSTSS